MDQGNSRLNRSVLKYFIPIVPAVMLIAATINMSCNTSGLPNLVTNSGSATPTSTSTAGTGSLAFVSNFGAGNVASFTRNTTTGALTRTATIAAGAKSGPKGLGLASGGGFLYVANRADNNIYEFAVNKSNGVLTPLSPASVSNGSGSGPDEIAINPAGTFLFVTGFKNGTVTSYSINTSTGQLTKVTGKVTGLVNPFGIAVDSTGSFVFVADNGSGLVFSFKINANGTLTEINSVPDLGTPGSPGFIALDPGGGFIYVTDLNAGVVAVLTVTAGTLAFSSEQPGTTGPQKPIGIGFATTAASGNFVFAANQGDGSMWSFLVPNPGVLQQPVTFGVGNVNLPTGLVVDPQNAFLYTTNQGAGTVGQFTLSAACISAGAPCFNSNVSTGGGSTGAPFDIILGQ
jgi:6-phosphogluconolactonase (cycloisomerase 2 family)